MCSLTTQGVENVLIKEGAPGAVLRSNPRYDQKKSLAASLGRRDVRLDQDCELYLASCHVQGQGVLHATLHCVKLEPG